MSKNTAIQRISAINFRNYKKVSAEISPHWTSLLGQNGAGKTNFLELIILCAQGFSFRGKLKELPRWGANKMTAKAQLSNGKEIVSRVILEGAGKAVHKRTINGKPVQGIENNPFPIILFLPQEEFLLDSTSGRRKILSRGLILQSQAYRRMMLRYQRVLKQRNSLLRLHRSPFSINIATDLRAWTELMIEPIMQIWEIRQDFVETLNRDLSGTVHHLGGGKKEVLAELSLGGYSGTAKEITKAKLLERFNEAEEKEITQKTTLIGPHRDRLNFISDGRDVLSIYSRGQKRLLLLAVHVVEGNYASSKTGVEPLYVLDDIFSELDEIRRQSIANALCDKQVIVTSADERILPRLKGDNTFFKIEDGVLANWEKYAFS